MEFNVKTTCPDERIKVNFGSVIQMSDSQKKEYESEIEKHKEAVVRLEKEKAEAYEQGLSNGKDEEYNGFWDNYQSFGELKNYARAFAGKGWNDETFKPKYDLICNESATRMFCNSQITDLEAILEKQGVKLNLSVCPTADYMFYAASVTTVPVLDLSNATSIGYLFCGASNLKTVRKLILSTDGDQQLGDYFFFKCSSLENLNIQGNIGCNVDFSYCPLTGECIENLVFNLYTGIGNQTRTAKFSKKHIDQVFETAPEANDGSESNKWYELCRCRPMWDFVLV